MSKRSVVWLVMVAVGLSLSVATAQPADDLKALREEIETLKRGQSAIQKDLQDIKELLRGRTAPPPIVRGQAPAPAQDLPIDLTGAPTKGAPTAKVTMVEYTDYQ